MLLVANEFNKLKSSKGTSQNRPPTAIATLGSLVEECQLETGLLVHNTRTSVVASCTKPRTRACAHKQHAPWTPSRPRFHAMLLFTRLHFPPIEFRVRMAASHATVVKGNSAAFTRRPCHIARRALIFEVALARRKQAPACSRGVLARLVLLAQNGLAEAVAHERHTYTCLHIAQVCTCTLPCKTHAARTDAVRMPHTYRCATPWRGGGGMEGRKGGCAASRSRGCQSPTRRLPAAQ